MSNLREQGRLLELNAADWLLLLAGVVLAAVLSILIGLSLQATGPQGISDTTSAVFRPEQFGDRGAGFFGHNAKLIDR